MAGHGWFQKADNPLSRAILDLLKFFFDDDRKSMIDP
jgi:hypothetical protein